MTAKTVTHFIQHSLTECKKLKHQGPDLASREIDVGFLMILNEN